MKLEVTLTDWHAAPGRGALEKGGKEGVTGEGSGTWEHQKPLEEVWRLLVERVEAWWQQAAVGKHSVYANVCRRKKVKSPIIIFGFVVVIFRKLDHLPKDCWKSNHWKLHLRHDMQKKEVKHKTFIELKVYPYSIPPKNTEIWVTSQINVHIPGHYWTRQMISCSTPVEDSQNRKTVSEPK